MAIIIERQLEFGKNARAFYFDTKLDSAADQEAYEAGLEHEEASFDSSTFAGRVFAKLTEPLDSEFPEKVSNPLL
jgi:hypothetical protein